MNEKYCDELKKLKKALEKENIDIKDYLLYDINKRLERLLEDRDVDAIEY